LVTLWFDKFINIIDEILENKAHFYF